MLGSSIRQVSKVLNISWPNGTNTNLWRKHLGLHPPPKKKHHRPKMTESRFLRWWLTPFMHFRGVGSQCLMSWTCGIGKTGTLATKTHGKKLVFTGPEGRLLLLFLLLGWWVGGVFSRDSSLWRWGPIIQWCTWRSTNRKIFIHRRFVRSVFFFLKSIFTGNIYPMTCLWHIYPMRERHICPRMPVTTRVVTFFIIGGSQPATLLCHDCMLGGASRIQICTW